MSLPRSPGSISGASLLQSKSATGAAIRISGAGCKGGDE